MEKFVFPLYSMSSHMEICVHYILVNHILVIQMFIFKGQEEH